MLRLVGKRLGPVIRTRPPIDSTARMIEWDNKMDALAERPRTGRFVREPQSAPGAQQDILSH